MISSWNFPWNLTEQNSYGYGYIYSNEIIKNITYNCNIFDNVSKSELPIKHLQNPCKSYKTRQYSI